MNVLDGELSPRAKHKITTITSTVRKSLDQVCLRARNEMSIFEVKINLDKLNPAAFSFDS